MPPISRAVALLLLPQGLVGNSICICGIGAPSLSPVAERPSQYHSCCCSHEKREPASPAPHKHNPGCNHCGPNAGSVLPSERPVLPTLHALTDLIVVPSSPLRCV